MASARRLLGADALERERAEGLAVRREGQLVAHLGSVTDRKPKPGATPTRDLSRACMRLSRSAIDGDQAAFVGDVPVRKLRCGDCRVRWSHLPEGLSELVAVRRITS